MQERSTCRRRERQIFATLTTPLQCQQGCTGAAFAGLNLSRAVATRSDCAASSSDAQHMEQFISNRSVSGKRPLDSDPAAYTRNVRRTPLAAQRTLELLRHGALLRDDDIVVSSSNYNVWGDPWVVGECVGRLLCTTLACPLLRSRADPASPRQPTAGRCSACQDHTERDSDLVTVCHACDVQVCVDDSRPCACCRAACCLRCSVSVAPSRCVAVAATAAAAGVKLLTGSVLQALCLRCDGIVAGVLRDDLVAAGGVNTMRQATLQWSSSGLSVASPARPAAIDPRTHDAAVRSPALLQGGVAHAHLSTCRTYATPAIQAHECRAPLQDVTAPVQTNGPCAPIARRDPCPASLSDELANQRRVSTHYHPLACSGSEAGHRVSIELSATPLEQSVEAACTLRPASHSENGISTAVPSRAGCYTLSHDDRDVAMAT